MGAYNFTLAACDGYGASTTSTVCTVTVVDILPTVTTPGTYFFIKYK
jgi:hypothetical protein